MTDEILKMTPAWECQPAAYWFWQRIPAREEITRQTDEMKKAGYSLFFIQPRISFPLEQYLSPPYLDAYRFAVETASRLDMKVGIYDDYNWNSGHAGGLTVRGADHLRERHLFWTTGTIAGKTASLKIGNIHSCSGDGMDERYSFWTYECGRPVWGDWKIVSAVVYDPQGVWQQPDGLQDFQSCCQVISSDDNSVEIRVHLPAEEWSGKQITVFASAVCKSSRMINYLDSEAARRFIQVGYEPYREVVGEYFGSTIPCIFMDHPRAGFYRWDELEGTIGNSLMYHPSLRSTFVEEHHYPMERALLSFLLPEMSDTARYRCNFFQTYSQLAMKNYLGQTSAWAHENHLLFAGHELLGYLGQWGFQGGFEEMDVRTNFGCDYFGVGRYKDISTVDASNSDPQIGAKMGASIARAQGSQGCMLEQYYWCSDPSLPGIAGRWDLTLDEMRAQAIRHTFFGARQYIFHGYYLDDYVDGRAIFDFAPGINYEPWFKFHRKFADELARLSSFMSATEPEVETAVLYPLNTVWAADSCAVIKEHSSFWNEWLTRQGIGFDIVDENSLALADNGNGCYGKGTIGFHTYRYRTLILPGVSVVSKNLFEALQSFVLHGGRLMLSGSVPQIELCGEQSSDISEIIRQWIQKYRNVVFYPEIPAGEEMDRWKSRFQAESKVSFQNLSENDSVNQVWKWSGRQGDHLRLALFNDSLNPVSVEMHVPKTGAVNAVGAVWDPLSGDSRLFSESETTDADIRFSVSMQANQLLCFQFSPAALVRASARVDDMAAARAEQNSLSLIRLEHGWSFSVPGQARVFPFKVTCGWEEQGFQHYSGMGIYEIQFCLPAEKESAEWELVIPHVSTSLEVYLNHRLLGVSGWPPHRICLPGEFLSDDQNLLRLQVYNTAANKYFHHSPYQKDGHFPSGILSVPLIRTVKG